MRGQINITIAILGVIGVITGSAFTAWATASTNIYQVREQVGIIEERENNHYAEVQKQLDRIDKKLDQLIKLK